MTFLYILLYISPICAFQSYQASIPNGNNINVESSPWPGLGHTNRGGGGSRNLFGADFAAAGKKWTKELCAKDSDGDGLTNGQELGDPECKWSKDGGVVPQFDTGLTHPGIASTEEVMREIDSCTNYQPPSSIDTINTQLNLTFTPYNVPSKPTTYAKFAFNMADLIQENGLATDQGTYFGVKFGVINKNIDVVHHLILYGCAAKPKGNIFNAPSETNGMNCESLRYAWAVGGKDFCLPPSIGIEFDVSDRNAAWHVLEIHYDNPQSHTSIVDTSGIHIQLVQKKASSQMKNFIPAGFLWVGVGLNQMSIPPKKKSYHLQAKCQYKNIPSNGITVFAFINHAHLLGRKLWTSLERDGKYQHDMGCDAQYNFDLQQILPFEKKVKLYSKDTLYANCVYDSTERTEVTPGGDETTNEMCINFLVYYPLVNGNMKCLTKPKVVTPTSIAEEKKCCAGQTTNNGTVCSGTASGGTQKSILPTWLIVHIVCMIVGWLILLPIGIMLATTCRHKTFFGHNWFSLHWKLNTAGLFIATIGAVAAFASLPTHVDTPHKILGLIVMVFGLLQPLNAYFRPGHEVKSTQRMCWEILHKYTGRGVGIGAFVNIILGAIVLRKIYLGNPIPIFVCVGIFIVVMLGLIGSRIVNGNGQRKMVELAEVEAA